MNPFKFSDDDIREALEKMPPEDRGPWQQMLDGRAQQVREMNRLAAERKFCAALGFVGSEGRAQQLAAWDQQFHFTDSETRELLTYFWSITEAWSGDPYLRSTMMGLLERVAPIYVVDPARPHPLPEVPALTIYRGNLGERPDGGSWTLNPSIAARFARMAMSPRGMFLGMYREDGVPTVWRGRIDRDRVLGYFDDRDEAEVVARPGDVRDIERFSWERGSPYGFGKPAAEAAPSADVLPKGEGPRGD